MKKSELLYILTIVGAISLLTFNNACASSIGGSGLPGGKGMEGYLPPNFPKTLPGVFDQAYHETVGSENEGPAKFSYQDENGNTVVLDGVSSMGLPIPDRVYNMRTYDPQGNLISRINYSSSQQMITPETVEAALSREIDEDDFRDFYIHSLNSAKINFVDLSCGEGCMTRSTGRGTAVLDEGRSSIKITQYGDTFAYPYAIVPSEDAENNFEENDEHTDPSLYLAGYQVTTDRVMRFTLDGIVDESAPTTGVEVFSADPVVNDTVDEMNVASMPYEVHHGAVFTVVSEGPAIDILIDMAKFYYAKQGITLEDEVQAVTKSYMFSPSYHLAASPYAIWQAAQNAQNQRDVKRIYTVEEATQAVKGNKNTFSIRYR